MKLGKQVWVLVCAVAVDVVLLVFVLFGLVRSMETSAGGEYIEPKYVALTFDDGPNREFTEQLLDGLKMRDVRASFFLLGTCIEGNEDIVKRMDEEGHLIGVHGMKHADLTKESLEHVVTQIRETSVLISNLTGKTVEYIRPPYGNWSEKLGETVSKELRLTPAFWDVDSLDWELRHTGKIVQKVVSDVENGDIILLHDEFGTSVEAAFQIIDNLMAKGYTFVTVDELVID